MNIYGHDVELPDPEPNHFISDVVVVARFIDHSGDRIGDGIITATTDQTTGMIQRAMVREASDLLETDDYEDDDE